MKYLLAMNYYVEGVPPAQTWPAADLAEHIAFQGRLNDELTASGELVDGQGLAGPDEAKIVVSDGQRPPVVSDGPFPESKEFLAGYRIVEVPSLERALEIAAAMSAAPGPDGAPIMQPIEVRQVMSAPDVPA